MRTGWITVCLCLLAGAAVHARQHDQPPQTASDYASEARQGLETLHDKDARVLVKLALELDPQNVEAKEVDAALKTYERIDSLRAAADKDDVGAMLRLGNRLAVGKGMARDPGAAMALFRKAAEAGNVEGLYRVALTLDATDREAATSCIQAAAEAGHVVSMVELGRRYHHGVGVAADPAKAVQWFRKAADAGSAFGMVDLAGEYNQGNGVARDVPEARRLCQEAEAQLTDRLRAIPQSPSAYHDLGMLEVLLRRPAEAVKVLKKGAETTQDPDLRYSLVELLIKDREYAAAAREGQLAVSNDPENQPLRHMLTYALMMTGQLDQALVQIDASLKQDQHDAVAISHRAWIKSQRNDLAGAADDYRQVLRIGPATGEIQEYLGEVLERLGKFDDAAHAYEKSLQIEPARRVARLRLLEIELDRRDWAAADRNLAQAESNPALASDPQWPRLRSRIWIARGNPAKAIEAEQKALDLGLKDWDDLGNLLGTLLVSHADPTKVLALSDVAMKDASGSRCWSIRAARGEAFAALKETGKALTEYDSAMSALDLLGNDLAAEQLGMLMSATVGPAATIQHLEPHLHARWLVPLMLTYGGQNNYRKAAAIADDLTAGKISTLSKPGQQRVWEVAGQVYQRFGEIDRSGFTKAEKAYSTSLSLLEGTPRIVSQIGVLNNLAYLLATRPSPDLPRALQYSTRAVALMDQAHSTSYPLLDTHGWCLVLSDRLDEGMKYLTRAAEDPAAGPDSHYHLAEAYLRKRMPREALDQLAKARLAVDAIKKFPGALDPGVVRSIPEAEKRARTMLEEQKNVEEDEQ